MSDTMQSKKSVGMRLPVQIGGHMKCICTREETEIMSFISTGNKKT